MLWKQGGSISDGNALFLQRIWPVASGKVILRDSCFREIAARIVGEISDLATVPAPDDYGEVQAAATRAIQHINIPEALAVPEQSAA